MFLVLWAEVTPNFYEWFGERTKEGRRGLRLAKHLHTDKYYVYDGEPLTRLTNFSRRAFVYDLGI